MENYIKISELAKIMKVSVHQLRYFEKKGIFSPAYIDTNGYRMYGVDEIYRLSNILLLRDLQIPVHEIYELVHEYSSEQCEYLLENSLKQLQEQIEQLTSISEKIQQVLSQEKILKERIGDFQIQYLPKRNLSKREVLSPSGDIDLNCLKANADSFSTIFNDNFIYLYDEKSLIVYIEGESKIDMVLEEGEYLCGYFLIKENEDIKRDIKALEDYITDSNFTHCGPTILYEKSYSSIFHKDAIVYEIQRKIQLKDV